MSEAARVETFEKITYVDPPRQPLPTKPLSGPSQLSTWYRTFQFEIFGQKPLVSIWLCIFKPQKPYGLGKNTSSNLCFVISL